MPTFTRDTFSALDAWFRSQASGTIILVLLTATALFYGGARLVVRRASASQIVRVLDTVAFLLLVVVGILFIVGGPFNE